MINTMTPMTARMAHPIPNFFIALPVGRSLSARAESRQLQYRRGFQAGVVGRVAPRAPFLGQRKTRRARSDAPYLLRREPTIHLHRCLEALQIFFARNLHRLEDARG